MSDLALGAAVLGLAALWYVAKGSERGQRIFAWVFVLALVSFLVYGALWGACGRWGPWIEGFCDEPPDGPW